MGKNKQRKPGKDKITGLSVTFSDIGTIKSDVVYGIDSKVGMFFADLIKDSQVNQSETKDVKVEFEFNDRFIVCTLFAESEEPGNQGRQQFLTRLAQSGQYSYKNGKLAAATVNSRGQSWPDGVGTGRVIYADPGGGITVNNTSSYSSYINSLEPLIKEANKIHAYLDFGMDGTNDDQIVGLGESGVRSFGGGNIFYKGWEANPFASNLI